jgi:predicted membrane metal-binding protein
MKALLVGVLSPTMAFVFYFCPQSFSYFTLVCSLLGFLLCFVCFFLKYFFRFLPFLTLFFFIIIIFCMRGVFTRLPIATDHFKGLVIDTHESLRQIRVTIETHSHQKVLGIFYKRLPSKRKVPKVVFIDGVLKKIRFTKTQSQLTLESHNFSRILVTFYKNNALRLRNSLINLKMGDKLLLSINKIKDKVGKGKRKQGYTHKASGVDILNINGKPLRSLQPSFTSIALAAPKIGQEVVIFTKKLFKPVLFLKYPHYLFAQNISYYGALKDMKISNPLIALTLFQKVNKALRAFYNHSIFASFYNAIFLGDKRVKKPIYELFRKTDMIPFLVVGGIHINIILSCFFFLGSLIGLFTNLFLRTKNSFKLFIFHIKRKPGLRSPILFLIFFALLLFYLTLMGFPVIATRAIVTIFLIALFYYFNISTTYYEILFLTSFILFLLFPYWIAAPLGLIYSFVALLGIYLSLPLIQKVGGFVRSRFLKYLIESFLFSFLVTLFVIPVALYNFHYYNWVAVILNIPLSLLFVIFIYLGFFATLTSFIVPAFGHLLLYIDDFVVTIILKILKLSNSFSFLKTYVDEAPSLITIIIFYIVLISLLRELQKSANVIPRLTI